MKNIDMWGQGGVVAAPDNSTPGGSYYYHWMRDAALSMRGFMELNDFKIDQIKPHMEHYV
jgi:glucoamylase